MLRTLEFPLNLTIRLPLTARTAWTSRNLVILPELLPLETLSKHLALFVVSPLVRKSLFKLSRATTSGWVVARLGLPGAKVRRDGAEGWIVEQPLRETFAMVQVVWLSTARY